MAWHWNGPPWWIVASINLSTIDAAISSRLESQVAGFKESPLISSLLRTAGGIVDKCFVLRIENIQCLDGSPGGYRQQEASRQNAALIVEFARKMGKTQPPLRRAAQDNAQDIIKALCDRAWAGSIGSGGPRFIYRSQRFSFSREGDAVVGSINFDLQYEFNLS